MRPELKVPVLVPATGVMLGRQASAATPCRMEQRNPMPIPVNRRASA